MACEVLRSLLYRGGKAAQLLQPHLSWTGCEGKAGVYSALCCSSNSEEKQTQHLQHSWKSLSYYWNGCFQTFTNMNYLRHFPVTGTKFRPSIIKEERSVFGSQNEPKVGWFQGRKKRAGVWGRGKGAHLRAARKHGGEREREEGLGRWRPVLLFPRDWPLPPGAPVWIFNECISWQVPQPQDPVPFQMPCLWTPEALGSKPYH